MKLHIGIDNTDSLYGGCTTYVGALIVEELLKIKEIKFIDYPNLIRLNPNIPWKTRGNGAIALRIEIKDSEESIMEKIEELVTEKVWENSYVDDGAEPAIAFLIGDPKEELKIFALESVKRIINIETAEKIAKYNNVKLITLKNKKRGIIGALSAVGIPLTYMDYTFELLTYRKRENWGTERKIDIRSIYEMDRITSPYTFNNIDYNAQRVLITPRGPDPVLYGIRGESPKILLAAMQKIKVYEPIERWVIYRTNQGTDMHYRKVEKITDIRSYDAIRITGKIYEKPKVIPGGHVILSITDNEKTINCAVYEPTENLKKIAVKLMPEDIVELYGVTKPIKNGKLTLNIEKINIKKLINLKIQANPKCPICGKTMKSEGKDKGYECKKCKYKSKNEKREIPLQRKIIEGIYLPPQKSQRHLTKPIIRYGSEKNHEPCKPIKNWYWSETLNDIQLL
ncbi:MAG: tRNA(Ile)(2)-agmatinylcytidine synthase [Candidatus Methanomethylicia archaeon]|nr:tRNA(Ile)(2)-agmatinylcytidine synthase [Candidatus Methanomethylicia archaeon]MCX8169137.1 tRNA(Ile)(2)-agmatinylcytidine synthase [Candidatus Methanomethylicia archaeon]MDW7988869.1 tRNA(Ile)(2)-agmatinylcytidine synthase [Nitrososphaerota archaeon]